MEHTKTGLSDVKSDSENGISPRLGVPWRGDTLHANWREGGWLPTRLKKKTGTPLCLMKRGISLGAGDWGSPHSRLGGGATLIPWVGVPLQVLWRGDALFPGRGVGALSAISV